MIVTDRLKLREWRDADKAALAEIHSDPEVMELLGGTKSPLESAEIIEGLKRRFAAGEPIFWAVERMADGALVGAIGLNKVGPEYPFGPALEVGWRLGRRFWGEGYATEAGVAALAYAFGSLGANRVFAFAVWSNQRSQGVMRRIGMTRVQGGDFAHPHLPATHPLSRHVLYVAEPKTWDALAAP